MKISIMGAGIGGLTAAIALQQKGLEVSVYEQTDAFKKIGAGIILGNNAMQVYRALGMYESLVELGRRVESMNLTDHRNKIISGMPLKRFEQQYNSINLAIHRADLQDTLVKQVQQGTIQFNKQVSHVSSDGKIQFTDGSSENSDCIIGADGIHSAVRSAVFGSVELRNSRQICWRMVVPHQLSAEFEGVFTEMWGKGSRVGFGQINEREVYCFALVNDKSGEARIENKNWRSFFSDFHPEVQSILEKADLEKTHVALMKDFEPISSWYTDKVVLLGDAAHAMTPNMGQGAGQSIEDAFYLADLIFKIEDINDQQALQNAFQRYQAYRKPKVDMISKNSWRIGSIAQLENGLLRSIRNTGMRIVPSSANMKMLHKIFAI